jgi:hypothetical protein
MEQDIGIGMALQTAVVGNGHASQNQGAALDQRVNVVTHAYAKHGVEDEGRVVRSQSFSGEFLASGHRQFGRKTVSYELCTFILPLAISR